MSSKRIEILTKASNSLKISLKCHARFKKSHAFSKQKPRSNCRIATMASPPLLYGVWNTTGSHESSNTEFASQLLWVVWNFMLSSKKYILWGLKYNWEWWEPKDIQISRVTYLLIKNFMGCKKNFRILDIELEVFFAIIQQT
jgi:hypothetical protein